MEWPEVSAIEQFTIIWSNITHLNWNLHEVSAILLNHVQDTGEIESSYLILMGVEFRIIIFCYQKKVEHRTFPIWNFDYQKLLFKSNLRSDIVGKDRVNFACFLRNMDMTKVGDKG